VASDTPCPRLLRSMGVQSPAAVRGCALLATDSQGKPVIAGQSVTRTCGNDAGGATWPEPPPCAVNVLLAALCSTLTAAAFRPGWLVGFGFGETKAALCF